jgi:hypothetical protein
LGTSSNCNFVANWRRRLRVYSWTSLSWLVQQPKSDPDRCALFGKSHYHIVLLSFFQHIQRKREGSIQFDWLFVCCWCVTFGVWLHFFTIWISKICFSRLRKKFRRLKFPRFHDYGLTVASESIRATGFFGITFLCEDISTNFSLFVHCVHIHKLLTGIYHHLYLSWILRPKLTIWKHLNVWRFLIFQPQTQIGVRRVKGLYKKNIQNCQEFNLHSNFFFTEAQKKTSGFRSTEQTVKISVQFCNFWSSVIQVYGMNLLFERCWTLKKNHQTPWKFQSGQIEKSKFRDSISQLIRANLTAWSNLVGRLTVWAVECSSTANNFAVY